MNKLKVYYLLISLIFLVIWFILPIKYLIHFTTDDTYFYLKVACNFASGYGSSFDGIDLTNGYHPLWFLILSMYFFLINLFVKINPELLLRFTFFLVTLLNLLSISLSIKIFDKLNILESIYSRIGFFLLTIPFSFFYLVGTEQNLLIFIYLMYIYLTFNTSSSLHSNFKFIIPSLLFLARIDLGLVLAISTIIFDYFRNDDKKVFISSIILITTIFLYAFLNFIFFGTLSSVSSLYKFNLNVSQNLKFIPAPLTNPIDFMILILIIFCGIFYQVNKKKIAFENLRIFEMTYLISILFLFFHLLFDRYGIREWYYIFPLYFSLFLISIRMNEVNLDKILFFISGVIFLVYFTIFRMNYYNHNSAFDFAKEVKEIVREDERIYQIDYSGLISFFSERKIINGDGLMNNYEYYKILKQGRLLEYLKRVNPDYLIFYSFSKINTQDNLIYDFYLFKSYRMKFPLDRIKLKAEFEYGGLFRKKYGEFYLVLIKDLFKNDGTITETH